VISEEITANDEIKETDIPPQKHAMNIAVLEKFDSRKLKQKQQQGVVATTLAKLFV
jgi:hypothetical protein